MRPRIANPAYAAHVAATAVPPPPVTPTADALAASVVQAPGAADTTAQPATAVAVPNVDPVETPGPITTEAIPALPAIATVGAATLETGKVLAIDTGGHSPPVYVAVSEAEAFAHPAVQKYIADLDAWYESELVKIRAEVKGAVATVTGLFTPKGGVNNVHADNSIDAVNAKSPTAPVQAAT